MSKKCFPSCSMVSGSKKPWLRNMTCFCSESDCKNLWCDVPLQLSWFTTCILQLGFYRYIYIYHIYIYLTNHSDTFLLVYTKPCGNISINIIQYNYFHISYVFFRWYVPVKQPTSITGADIQATLFHVAALQRGGSEFLASRTDEPCINDLPAGKLT
jgi:hypothetical protein